MSSSAWTCVHGTKRGCASWETWLCLSRWSCNPAFLQSDRHLHFKTGTLVSLHGTCWAVVCQWENRRGSEINHLSDRNLSAATGRGWALREFQAAPRSRERHIGSGNHHRDDMLSDCEHRTAALDGLGLPEGVWKHTVTSR